MVRAVVVLAVALLAVVAAEKAAPANVQANTQFYGMSQMGPASSVGWCLFPMMFGFPPHPYCFWRPSPPPPPPPPAPSPAASPTPVPSPAASPEAAPEEAPAPAPSPSSEPDGTPAQPGDQESVDNNPTAVGALMHALLQQAPGSEPEPLGASERAMLMEALENAAPTDVDGNPNDAILRGGPAALSPFFVPTFNNAAVPADEAKTLASAAQQSQGMLPQTMPLVDPAQAPIMQQQASQDPAAGAAAALPALMQTATGQMGPMGGMPGMPGMGAMGGMPGMGGMGAMGMAAPAAPAAPPGSFPPFQAWNSNGLLVMFNCSKDPANASVTNIEATFTNSTGSAMDALNFQVAVPKYMQLKMTPPNSTTVPPNNSGQVKQVFKVANSLQGQKPLLLRIKVDYSVMGQPRSETGQVDNFPAGC